MKKKIILSVALVLLIVMIATIFAACTPSVDSVAKKFENKDYKVTKTEKVIVATKLLEGKAIEITWYDSEEDAKKIEEAFKGDDNKTIKRKGAAVAIGDADSIKLF